MGVKGPFVLSKEKRTYLNHESPCGVVRRGNAPPEEHIIRGAMHDATKQDGAVARRTDGRLADITVTRKGRSLAMLGPAGPARELSILPPFPAGAAAPAPEPDGGTGRPFAPQCFLPVLIGSGAGYALAELVARLERDHGPDFLLAVVDKEDDILEASGLRPRFAAYSGLSWFGNAASAELLEALTRWQTANGGLPLRPVLNPFYLRLDRDYYRAAQQACEASAAADFWSKARHAKFKEPLPRILLMTSTYFLMGEIKAACERLGYPHYLLQLPEGELGQREFIESLLSAVVDFKPDFIFTINHLGVDREGVLVDLLEKLRLPLASWFVDNPHLILYRYARLKSPWTAILTWDADNLASLSELGFENVSYLPLGVDATRFHPLPRPSFPGLPPAWDGKVAFVGNSMVDKVLTRRQKLSLPPLLADSYHDIAAAFGASDERLVSAWLAKARPAQYEAFLGLASVEDRLSYETMLTWEATRQYRYACIEGIFPFAPLLVGDKGWKRLVPPGVTWHYHPELAYYDQLPAFYPCVAVNFNCTSKQMKGAVNQRVFDVPATGAFLLTDYREQVENLFEPGTEIICYRSPEEAKQLAAEYLARPERRAAVAEAARRRILAEHTYDHRLRVLAKRMRSLYA